MNHLSSGRSGLVAVALILALAVVGCGDSSGGSGAGGGGGSSGSGPSAEDGVCYFELRSSFWCDDGQVEIGTWGVSCNQDAKSDCNSTVYVSGTEYHSGCEWETQFRNIEWISASECAARQEAGVLLANGTECAYHQDCQTGCCGSPQSGSVCVDCEEITNGSTTTTTGGNDPCGPGTGTVSCGGGTCCPGDHPVCCSDGLCYTTDAECTGDPCGPGTDTVDCGDGTCCPSDYPICCSDGGCNLDDGSCAG